VLFPFTFPPMILLNPITFFSSFIIPKTFRWLPAFAVLFSSCSYTVTNEIASVKSYQVYLTRLSEPKKQFPCMLLQLHDSTMAILQGKEKTIVPVNDVLHIRVKIKRDAWRGLGLGFVSGFVVGGVLGAAFADYDENPAGVIFGTAAAVAVITGASGALSNTTLNLSYPINGRENYYLSIREKLEKYTGFGPNSVP
jgi:hypothetical protein